MSVDGDYGADLAQTLEQLLSQLSLEPGPKSDYLRNAMTNANNILHNYNEAMDVEDARLKQDMC